MTVKRIGTTFLAVLALGLMGIGARAQVVFLPGYTYGGFLPINGGLGSLYGGYNPYGPGYGNYGAYNPYDMGYGAYGYQNPYLYNYPYGNTAYTYDANAAAQNAAANQTAIPRTNDTVSVRWQANNKVFMSWQGDNAMVSSITFALLDQDGKTLTEKTITEPPAQMTLTRTSKSAYSQIVIHYIN